MQDLRLSVAELLGRPGEYRDIAVRRPLRGVATALARLGDEGIEGDLRIESVIEGVLVTGRVRGDAVLQCARCLEEFDTEVGLRVCELYAGPGHEASDDEDAYQVEGMEIDLEPMVRDAVTLALPLNPLCREDCKGLCASCGADLNQGACDCKQDDFDPRWAALSDLRERLEN
ncbi:MAG: YceD family protein [Actinomycetota bacterium]